MTSKYPQKMGIELTFAGDHRHHTVSLGTDDVETLWDNDSIVLTVHLDEHDAKELYWDLLKIIPQLREDRR